MSGARRATWPCALVAACGAALARAEDPSGEAPMPDALQWRREYNAVSAAIDTLVRLHSAERLARLADPGGRPALSLPPGCRVVLLFWADDEVRVFLNGAPVGQTRLTPTRVEVPTPYLEAENELTAHCWDTDRVESGFMAGLYVEDATGRLHPVLTTAQDQGWRILGSGAAREIYYAHTQPDLPGARVIWGSQLFGEVHMAAHFRAADVSRALGRPARAQGETAVHDQPMDFAQGVARLVGLQARRQELADRLARSASHPDPDLRVREGKKLADGLAYTLGSAGALREQADAQSVARLAAWASRLPRAERQLVLREARQLLGATAATPSAALDSPGDASAADRRPDYVPPRDLGTRGEGAGVAKGASGQRRAGTLLPTGSTRLRTGLMAVALCAWTAVAGWRWWRLLKAVSWRAVR